MTVVSVVVVVVVIIIIIIIIIINSKFIFFLFVLHSQFFVRPMDECPFGLPKDPRRGAPPRSEAHRRRADESRQDFHIIASLQLFFRFGF